MNRPGLGLSTILTLTIRHPRIDRVGAYAARYAAKNIEVDQQFELSHHRKDRGGTQLTCYVSGATATLSLQGDKNPPELHVSASLFSRYLRLCIKLTPQNKSGLWRGLTISELAS